jgi:hypothetical protein
MLKFLRFGIAAERAPTAARRPIAMQFRIVPTLSKLSKSPIR